MLQVAYRRPRINMCNTEVKCSSTTTSPSHHQVADELQQPATVQAAALQRRTVKMKGRVRVTTSPHRGTRLNLTPDFYPLSRVRNISTASSSLFNGPNAPKEVLFDSLVDREISKG